MFLSSRFIRCFGSGELLKLTGLDVLPGIIIYSSKAACQMLQVLHWTLANGNKFFRILYGEGIWFSGQIASQVIEAGYAFCDPELR